jgi:hypothetical protein
MGCFDEVLLGPPWLGSGGRFEWDPLGTLVGPTAGGGGRGCAGFGGGGATDCLRGGSGGGAGEEASMMFSSRLTCIRSLDPVFVVCVGSLGQTAHSHFSMEICVKSFVREVFQKTQKQLPLLLLKRHRSHVGANSAA